MLRAIQFLGPSSGVVSVSSPLRPWKPLERGGISFMSVFEKSFSTSPNAADSLLFLFVSTRGCGCFRAFRVSAVRSESDGGSSSSPSASFQALAHMSKICFCQWCGCPTEAAIPDGDGRTRAICTLCGKIAYQNPKMHNDKVLLCKRKIQPSYGLWTLPAGYKEIGESAAEGAIRETWEEAGAHVELLSPFAQLDIPRIGQIYIIFRGRLKELQFLPGPKSLECRLFALDDIPFDSLAFSSMLVTLNMYIEDIKAGEPMFHYGTINKRPGSGASDIRAYTLDSHLKF